MKSTAVPVTLNAAVDLNLGIPGVRCLQGTIPMRLGSIREVAIHYKE